MTSTTDLHLTDPQAFLLDLYRAAVKDAQPLYSCLLYTSPSPRD